MVGDVQTDLFLEGVNTEHAKVVEAYEEGDHGGRNPGNNPENTNELAKEKIGITTALTPGVEPADVLGRAVGNGSTGRLGEETGGNAAPHTVGKVNGDGIDSIVNLELEEKARSAAVDPSGDDANEEGTVGGDDGGTGGNTNKATEAAVHGVGEIVFGFASLHLTDDGIGEHGSDGTSRGGQGGSDGTKCSNITVTGGGDGES